MESYSSLQSLHKISDISLLKQVNNAMHSGVHPELLGFRKHALNSFEKRQFIIGDRDAVEFSAVLSVKEMLRILFKSMLKVTLTRGIPRGEGGILESSNFSRNLLSLAQVHSPSMTWINIQGWL